MLAEEKAPFTLRRVSGPDMSEAVASLKNIFVKDRNFAAPLGFLEQPVYTWADVTELDSIDPQSCPYVDECQY